MWNVNRFLILLASLLMPIACAKHRVSVGVEAPEASSGRGSFKFLADKDSVGTQDAQGWEYHPPQLMRGAGMPAYPGRPLAERFGSAVVIARIVINSAGEVTDVTPEPGSTTGPYAADFFHAVETAVRKWRFTHPEWWLVEDGKDINGDGKPDYQKVIEIRQASASGDAEFLFELVGGQGKVSER